LTLQSNKFNYLIVGQGIAGTVLALTLLKHGKKVLVIDQIRSSSSSRVAAGLYNPIVFKRLTKSWMVDELLPCMAHFYKEAEQILNTTFFYEKEIVKLFTDENEKNFWQQKAISSDGKYLDPNVDDSFLNEQTIFKNNGASKVLHAGNLDTLAFLDAARFYFKQNNCLLEENFMFENGTITNKQEIDYKGIEADKLIFCEGHLATQNPYFKELPFKLTKGEVLTIETEEELVQEKQVINKGVYILPIGGLKYRVGATYEWEDLSQQTTEKGLNELQNKLNKVIKLPYKIIAHQAGVRPTVSDRRPLIGLHESNKVIGVFNGMGTKGVMLAPYFASHFYSHLEKHTPLLTEVDINRFSKNKVNHASI
jgi:glycine/D-amino acid oxidase-like deaminating enzyme